MLVLGDSDPGFSNTMQSTYCLLEKSLTILNANLVGRNACVNRQHWPLGEVGEATDLRDSIKGCFTQTSVKKESQPSSNSCNGNKIRVSLLTFSSTLHSSGQPGCYSDTIQLYLPLPAESLINSQEFGQEFGQK